MIGIQIESRDASVTIELVGELDADTSPSLLQRVTSMAVVPDEVVIDITELHFIDSSGISAFLKMRDWVQSAGGAFAVAHPTPAVHRVFEITGVLGPFGLE